MAVHRHRELMVRMAVTVQETVQTAMDLEMMVQERMVAEITEMDHQVRQTPDSIQEPDKAVVS